jgi:hypothetical protein
VTWSVDGRRHGLSLVRSQLVRGPLTVHFRRTTCSHRRFVNGFVTAGLILDWFWQFRWSCGVSSGGVFGLRVWICEFHLRASFAYFAGGPFSIFGGFLPTLVDFVNFRAPFFRFLSFFRLRDTSHKQTDVEAVLLPIANKS